MIEVSERVRTVGSQRTEGSRRMNRMGLSLQHLLWYADGGEDMLNMTVTSDKS
jgi:hypothetical protein